MALSPNINSREFDCFTTWDTGETAKRTKTQGTIRPSGLNVAGKITEVTLASGSWSAIPATPLSNRNAISIQNNSGTEIKVNYDNTESGYVGMIVANGSERFYDITDSIIIYAKSQSGTPTVVVEEIS